MLIIDVNVGHFEDDLQTISLNLGATVGGICSSGNDQWYINSLLQIYVA